MVILKQASGSSRRQADLAPLRRIGFHLERLPGAACSVQHRLDCPVDIGRVHPERDTIPSLAPSTAARSQHAAPWGESPALRRLDLSSGGHAIVSAHGDLSTQFPKLCS